MESASLTKRFPAVGRCDLVQLLQAFPGEEERIAALLGYTYQESNDVTLESKGVKDVRSGASKGLEGRNDKKPKDQEEESQKPLMASFWYVKERKSKAIAPIQDIAPLKVDELPNITIEACPPSAPIIPWAGLWPFIKEILSGERISRDIDETKAIQRIARGEFLDRIPRKTRKAWASRARIVVDVAPRLFPFWGDFNQVVDGAVACLGSLRLKTSYLKAGPFGLDYNPKTLSVSPFVLHPFSAPLLILSDLGAYGSDNDKETWKRFGEFLRERGARPVVLTPVPTRLWDQRHTRLFQVVPWDDTAPRPFLKFARPRDFYEGADSDRHVDDLLALCSTAIRVEPRLMRALRRLMPTADVGTEGKAWNHENVLQSFLAFSFKRGYDQKYRDILAGQGSTVQRDDAFACIEEFHKFLPSEVQLEARLSQHVLKFGDASIQDKDLQQFLTWLGNKYEDLGDPESVKAWLRRLAWRLPKIDNLDGGEHLRQKVAEVFEEEIERGEAVPVTTYDSGDERKWKIIQIGEKLVFKLDGEKERTECPRGCIVARVSGGDFIEVPDSSGAPTTVKHKLEDGYTVNLTEHGPLPIATSEVEMLFDIMHKPDWAESVYHDKHNVPFFFREQMESVQGENYLKRGMTVATSKVGVSDYAIAEIFRTGLLATLPLNDSIIMWAFPRDVASDKNSMLFPSLNEDGKEQGQWVNLTQLELITAKGIPPLSWATSHGFDQYGLYADIVIAGVTQRMRYILPGSFLMGSPEDEPEGTDREHQHEVTLTRGYWLADTACTQELWTAVMGGNPSGFKGEKDLPVEKVTWKDCVRFVETVNKKHPGLGLRLPTEAQWEYACRAGTGTPFSFGKTITTDQVNYNGKHPYTNSPKGEYRKKTAPVKELPSNQWGLHQMHGNVWEWCADWFGDYDVNDSIDPTGPKKGGIPVLRGGSWIYGGGSVRSAIRSGMDPGSRYGSAGFRFSRGL